MTVPYTDQFAAFSANGGGEGPAWLPALRAQAFERFAALGFPTTRDEDWHFTSVTPIAERTFKAVKAAPTALTLSDIEPWLVDESWQRLVFVNGRLEPSLSNFSELPADVQVSTTLVTAALAVPLPPWTAQICPDGWLRMVTL